MDLFSTDRSRNLSPDEQSILDGMAACMLPFRVTVRTPGHAPEHIGLIAADACDAVVKVIEILFPAFDGEMPTSGISIKVEPVNTSAIRRAA